MSEKLVPEFCLWCSHSKVKEGACEKCGTLYRPSAVRSDDLRFQKERRRVFRNDFHMSRLEMERTRHLKFRWER